MNLPLACRVAKRPQQEGKHYSSYSSMPGCRTVLLRKDRFDEREQDFYEALYTQSQAQFGTYVASGTVLNNYAHIFDLLIRLRQVGCMH